MPMYINHFKCNPSAWPADPKERLKVWKTLLGDADEMLGSEGPVKYTGWISNTEGYSLLEAETKAEIIGLCTKFWPYFHNDTMELVPNSEAGPAILAGAAG